MLASQALLQKRTEIIDELYQKLQAAQTEAERRAITAAIYFWQSL